MKILILSDSHRNDDFARAVLRRHPGAEAVFFLGDGEGDLFPYLRLPEQAYAAVRGNCDFGSDLPLFRVFDLEGKRFFCTHGHTYHVKSTLSFLRSAALAEGASVALFGHTHSPFFSEEAGLTLFNPGSLCSGDYGLLEIKNGRFQFFHKQL